MLFATDIYYLETGARSVGILFDWGDESPHKTIEEHIPQVEEYVPGQFYKRELPCILKLLERVELSALEAIIVDGHVYVDNDKKFGLGGHLWEVLERKVPVIGVAKSYFHGTEEVSLPVFRGDSKQPLYISCVGYDHQLAIDRVAAMHGDFRMPTLLKKLDQLSRGQ